MFLILVFCGGFEFCLCQNLKVVALGYIRPEMRFPGGLPELVSRINTDKAIASTQLDDEELKAYAGYPHLA